MKKPYVKVICLTVCLIIAIAGLSACSSPASVGQSNQPAAPSTEGSPTTPPVKMETVEVWTNSAHEKDLRVKQVDNFNNTTGKEVGINIKYTVYGNDYDNVISVAASSNQTPHLFRSGSGALFNYVQNGSIIPITELPGADEWLKQYEGKLIQDVEVFDGKVYTVPYAATTYRMMINKELFEKAGLTDYPRTWQQVREYARICTEAGGGRQFGFGLALQTGWTMDVYTMYAFQPSVGHRGYDFKTGTYRHVDFAPFLELLIDMRDEGSIFPGAEGLDADRLRAQFAEGNIAIMPAASFDIGVYTDQFPAKIDFAVIDIPVWDENVRYKTAGNTVNLMHVGPKAKQLPEKSFYVYKWLHSDENILEMYMDGKYIPFNDISHLITSEPAVKGWAGFANEKGVFSLPVAPNSFIKYEGDRDRNTYINILSGRKSDIMRLLEDLDNRYNSALQKAVNEGLDLNKFKLPDWETPRVN